MLVSALSLQAEKTPQGTGSGTPSKKEHVAVNTLGHSGITEEEAVALTDALRAEVGRTGKFRVMERSQMDQVLAEQGFQQSGACSDQACLVEMGQILGVGYIITGNIGKVGSTYSINIRLVDVRTSEIVREVTRNHRRSKDALLTRVIPGLGREVAGVHDEGKANRTAAIATIGGAVAVAVAVPVIIVLSRDESDGNGGGGGEGQEWTEVWVKW